MDFGAIGNLEDFKMALRQIFKKLNRHKNELGYGLDSIVTIYKDSRFGWMWKEPVFDKWFLVVLAIRDDDCP